MEKTLKKKKVGWTTQTAYYVAGERKGLGKVREVLGRWTTGNFHRAWEMYEG